MKILFFSNKFKNWATGCDFGDDQNGNNITLHRFEIFYFTDCQMHAKISKMSQQELYQNNKIASVSRYITPLDNILFYLYMIRFLIHNFYLKLFILIIFFRDILF